MCMPYVSRCPHRACRQKRPGPTPPLEPRLAIDHRPMTFPEATWKSLKPERAQFGCRPALRRNKPGESKRRSKRLRPFWFLPAVNPSFSFHNSKPRLSSQSKRELVDELTTSLEISPDECWKTRSYKPSIFPHRHLFLSEKIERSATPRPSPRLLSRLRSR